MRVVHWTLKNGSGLDRVAHDLAAAECNLGLDSIVVSSYDRAEWDKGVGADVHVPHSHVPDPIRKENKGKYVWIGHGTPEHVFQTSVEDNLKGGYGHHDTWMLVQWWMQHAHALVTFWPRHRWIWKNLCDRNTIVDCIPLGVDRSFWVNNSKGKFVGTPSIFSAENCHYIKWPLDLAMLWGEVAEQFPGAHLHLVYVPRDQHRNWFPLLNRCGAGFRSYITAGAFSQEDLRNAFSSVDYVCSFVRYGDFNRLCLEAKSCGAKIISFKGNRFADYWIDEGDQRVQRDQLISILKQETVPAQVTEEVPDIMETAEAMKKIYERIL